MLSVVSLAVAIVSALCFSRARGNARLLPCLLMLVFLGVFLFNLVQFAHPGL